MTSRLLHMLLGLVALGILGLWLTTPSPATAGVILQRPLYVGLDAGLVGFWSFDGPDMAGVTAYDRSGQGNHGTLLAGGDGSTLQRTPGRIGQGLQFFMETSSPHVNALAPSSLDFASGSFSVSGWFKPGPNPDSTGLYGKESEAPNRGFWMKLAAGNSLLARVADDTNTIAPQTSANVFTRGAWHHIVLVIDRSPQLARMYVNGVDKATTNTDISTLGSVNTTGQFEIGRVENDNNSGFDGLIDDLRVYNRALNPDEIKRLYNLGGTFKINAPATTGTLLNGLVGFWSFDGPDMAGNTAYDRSGQGNNGTLNSSGVTRTVGRIGQALASNAAIGSLVFMNDAPSLNFGTGSFTASFWFRCASDCSGRFMGKWDEVVGGFRFLVGDNHTFQIDITDGVDTVSASTNNDSITTIGTWYHFIVVADRFVNRLRAYRNGIEMSISPDDISAIGSVNNSQELAIFRDDTSGGTTFPGGIDDVRVYNRALSPDEIKRLYNLGGTFKVNAPATTGTLLNGLVGYWSFDGPDMAGVTAYDRSGQGNNGTLTNGPQRAIGKIGQALEFDGVDDQVNTANGNSVKGSSQVSISLWFKVKALGNFSQELYTENINTGNTPRLSLRISDSRVLIFDGRAPDTDGQTQWVLRTQPVFVPNTWYHVVAVFNSVSDVHTTYVDGVGQSNSVVEPALDGTNPFTVPLIGNGPFASFFEGSIDDVRIYNRALSPDEVKRLYLMGR